MPRPDTFKVTPPVNPPDRVMLMVYVVDEPRLIVREVGVPASVKSGAAGDWTTSVAVAVWLSVPLVPVAVKT